MVETPSSDRWDHGDAYERFIGRWSRGVAPAFVEWLALPAGLEWLDIGCGTGALSAAIADRARPAGVLALEPSEGFRATASRNLGDRAQVRAGRADAIPLADDSVDAVVSGLVLNFVPDVAAGLAEMARVLRRDGTLAAYVWDYAGRMDALRYFWDAAREIDPTAAAADEGARFPLCHPDRLREAFAAAGLRDVATHALEIETRFTDFDDYWQPFLGGQGPAPTWALARAEAERARLEASLRQRMPVAADGTLPLAARAWAVRGRR